MIDNNNPVVADDYKCLPPGGFKQSNRTREDIIKGALTLLAYHGPSTTTAILYTQEVTHKQATDVITYLRDKGLAQVIPATYEMRENYNLPPMVRNLITITEKGKRYLELARRLEVMLEMVPSAQSLKLGGNRGISPDNNGKAARVRNLTKKNEVLRSSSMEAWR